MAHLVKVVRADLLSKKVTMDSQVGVVGVAWYMMKDYDRCRSMFIDGDVLPLSYQEWKQKIELLRERLVGQGILVVQAYIDPDVFPDWCIANGCQLDSFGRDLFAASLAWQVMTEKSSYSD